MPPPIEQVPDVWRLAREDADRRAWSALAVLVPTGGALLVSFLFSPEAVESGRIILSAPCMMRHVFGIGCPTCGMTRAFMALSHGDLVRAFAYNTLSPLVYLAFWGFAAHASFGLGRALFDRLRLRRRRLAA